MVGQLSRDTAHKESTMSNKTIFCWNIAPIVHPSSRHSIHLAKFVVFFVELSASASVSALGISCMKPSRQLIQRVPIIQISSSFIGFVPNLPVSADVEAGYQTIVSNSPSRLMRAIKMSVTPYTLG